MLRHQIHEQVPAPVALSMLRLTHILLMLHASAIVALTYMNSELISERVFSVMVAAPMFLASFFGWLSATAKIFFGTAVFFCVFQALLLVALPMMMQVFFPIHLILFSLAAFYGASALFLARYSFMQPIPKKI